MISPVFIVDGFTEKMIIQQICPGNPIRRIDLNGKCVTIEAMAKKIASLIRLLGDRNYPIIILVDKEDRNISFQDMAIQLKAYLETEGIINKDIRIGVADRMIENWIIADWNSLGVQVVKPDNTDGINGASTIKKVMGAYDKTTDGVDFFINARVENLYEASESYKYFVDQLFDIRCGYLAPLTQTQLPLA